MVGELKMGPKIDLFPPGVWILFTVICIMIDIHICGYMFVYKCTYIAYAYIYIYSCVKTMFLCIYEVIINIKIYKHDFFQSYDSLNDFKERKMFFLA